MEADQAQMQNDQAQQDAANGMDQAVADEGAQARSKYHIS